MRKDIALLGSTCASAARRSPGPICPPPLLSGPWALLSGSRAQLWRPVLTLVAQLPPQARWESIREEPQKSEGRIRTPASPLLGCRTSAGYQPAWCLWFLIRKEAGNTEDSRLVWLLRPNDTPVKCKGAPT